ncbi:acetyl-CoA synthetase-like protein [Aspergillus ruber CBS 135680]|uniref:Acetyl-CoA synthetase-like protein n=1 Tax=Aspergillus ruber (strain CBS 135680) TaxID=1388766 RepID=A0A017SGM3_ASPRC|nr:acetyl-CoA synthetase-like protein [Aspergillus ruber CBS 135680]EYE95809.1 acetyl-CoA synthetase-like protein [Aspergillus ruber CBS 135680]
MDSNLALVHGPTEPALWSKTLGSFVDEQASRLDNRTSIIFPWQSVRLSYSQLADRSKVLARAMLEMGLRHGDCVGIMAGNCYQYIEVFLGGARIGCPVVVLNNTYTLEELQNAVQGSSCRLVFIASRIGTRDFSSHIKILRGNRPTNPALPELRRVVCLGNDAIRQTGVEMQSYNTFASNGNSVFMNDHVLKRAENNVTPDDVLNLQFTSGTTGSPKAAMLTHVNLLNNAHFVGDAMKLTPEDVICCPPPLFHCFGLVLGFLASFTHGSSIVFPSDFFNAQRVVDAIVSEDATVLLGVPTMYVSELEVMAKTGQRPRRLRTGLASGSAVSQGLMNELQAKMGVEKMLIAYGMTETSPVTFITALNDSNEKGTTTVGKAVPHTAAKVIDQSGKVVARGERGELCTSGFALQKGYWNNEEKTKEAMRRDESGVLWMNTGDEALLDSDGYAHITSRIKDIIIRGGENIFPREIEERLMQHASISEASVVGIKDERYGEVVGCFLKATEGTSKVTDSEVKQWINETLGRHKVPQYVFWIGEPKVGEDFPKTGSGKHQKHIMRDIGNRLVERSTMKAKI